MCQGDKLTFTANNDPKSFQILTFIASQMLDLVILIQEQEPSLKIKASIRAKSYFSAPFIRLQHWN